MRGTERSASGVSPAQIATAGGMLLEIAGVIYGLFHGTGLDRLLSLKPDAIALMVNMQLCLVALGLVWGGRKWGYPLATLLLVMGLAGNTAFILSSGLTAAGPALDQVWLLVRVVGSGVGLVYSLIALLERFGKLAPAALNSWQGAVLKSAGAAFAGMLIAGALVGNAPVAAATPDRIVQLDLADNKFMTTDLELPVGQHTALFLTNKDVWVHTFDIDALNVHVTVPGHSTAMAVVTPPAPGSWTYYCRIPGHREGGMVGTIKAR